MLAPNQRQLYLDALKPPAGYSLDRAVGTTFSLDLLTLLTVPLGFALLDWEDGFYELLRDPVKLLDSLRRYADRTTVFCQAGRIGIPARRHPLFAHLEKTVVEVLPPAPRRGVFHPKVWLLRFASEGEPVLYRFLCLSRNLTADRSLDTILSLDGEVADRERAYSRNHPLGEFIAALPGLARGEVPRERKAGIVRMAEEVRRADFRVPEPFDDFLEFIPLGFSARPRDVLGEVKGRTLFLSPFLSADYLDQFERTGSDILVSRAATLDQILPETLGRFGEVWALDEGVEEGTERSQDDEGADIPAQVEVPEETETSSEMSPFSGLHAKLYIDDQGWDAELLTGSANMTAAAFSQNVEFLVRLRGKKRKVGIDVFLGRDDKGGFSSLLRPYTSPEAPPAADETLTANQGKVDEVRAALSGMPLKLKVGGAGGQNGYNLELVSGARQGIPLKGTRVRAWPVTLPFGRAVSWRDFARDGHALFEGLSVSELTSFLAVSVEAGEDNALVRERFVRNLPLEDVPHDRMRLLLKETLGGPAGFLRYLLLLLGRDRDPMGGAADLLLYDRRGTTGAGEDRGAEGIPLFEELIRTFARDPSRLQGISRLVADLKATPGGSDVLPPGFEEAWAPIEAACREGGR